MIALSKAIGGVVRSQTEEHKGLSCTMMSVSSEKGWNVERAQDSGPYPWLCIRIILGV